MAKSSSNVETRVTSIDEAWLAKTEEPALEPDLAICDPHHHLWDFRRHRYLVPELFADMETGHRIVSTVFIECTAFYRADGTVPMRPVGETEFVNGQAAMAASGRYGATRGCAGIVGLADLTLGAAVEEVLAAHVAAGNGRFRGIRYAAGWEASEAIHNSHTQPGPERYLDPVFREGFAKLQPLGLSFDAWLYHPQLPDVIDLARAFPDQPIVMDHVGGVLGIGPYAGKRAEIFPVWQRHVRELARSENVHMKLGGLAMKICGFEFDKQARPPSSEELAAAWRPYIETCIEAFGVKRCMFESNFPVDKVSCSYAMLWNAFKRLAAGATAAEKQALFHDTAVNFYRLG
jgi:L-fuconolactonase